MARYTSIVGLSAERRIPRVGRIRLGEKVKMADGRERPSATDHFVVPPEVAKVFGGEPTVLEVMLPAEDLALVFPTAYKFWKGPVCWCTGDGAEGTRIDDATKAFSQVECPCSWLDHKNAKGSKDGCRPSGSLMMMIPQVSIGGVYQLDTPSVSNIIAIQSGIEHGRALLGRISWVPFTLSLVARNMTVDGAPKKVHLVNLVVSSFDAIAEWRRKLEGLRQLVGAATVAAEPVLEIEAPAEEPAVPDPELDPEPDPEAAGMDLDIMEGDVARLGKQLNKGPKSITVAIGTARRNGTLPLLLDEWQHQADGDKGYTTGWAAGGAA